MAYPYQNGYNSYYQPSYQQPWQAMQPQYQQPQTQVQQPVCRMVASREEASGTPVDFMGGLMIFPDAQNNRIYTKRWNAQTGMAEFGEYVPVHSNQIEAKPDPVMETLAGMQQQIAGIYKLLGAEEEAK